MATRELIDLVLEVAPGLVKKLTKLKGNRQGLTDIQVLCLISAATYEQLEENGKILLQHCEETTKAINGFAEKTAILLSRTERRP